MATFVVQSDSGDTANANAYITTGYFRSYHDARGNSIQTIGTTTYSNSDWQKAIVRATDYLDTRFTFIGDRQTRDQTTEWPRHNAYDRDDYAWTIIPEAVKEACAEYALIALTSTINPLPTRDDSGQAITRKKEVAGPFEEETVY